VNQLIAAPLEVKENRTAAKDGKEGQKGDRKKKIKSNEIKK